MPIKKHLSLAKQIELFEDLGLIIDDYKEFKYFLSMNKYYEIFEYYCEPFMKNFNKSTMRFDYNSSSKGIIQLADYDSCISTIVFKYIKILEKSFSSKIIYFMSKELIINTNNIFSNFHNIEKILNKYKTEKQLDFLSSLSFGELLKVFKNLNENIQYNIINSYNNLDFNKNQFIQIFEILIKVRNNIAHFKTLYNFQIEMNNENLSIIKQFIKRNKLDIKFYKNKIDLISIIKIIDRILSNNFNLSIISIFKEKTIKKIIDSNFINNLSANNILYRIGNIEFFI